MANRVAQVIGDRPLQRLRTQRKPTDTRRESVSVAGYVNSSRRWNPGVSEVWSRPVTGYRLPRWGSGIA
jgi:hypothetical protein